jgi:hypothetical protein
VDELGSGHTSENEDYDDLCKSDSRKRGRTDYDEICASGGGGHRRVHFYPRFDDRWSECTTFLRARAQKSDNTRHLEQIVAKDLVSGDVVYLFFEKQYHFYGISLPERDVILATLISSLEGGKPAPFEVSAIPPDLFVWKFSPASFAHFHGIETRGSTLHVLWPVSHENPTKRGRPAPIPNLQGLDYTGDTSNIYRDIIDRALTDDLKTTKSRTPRGNDLPAASAGVFSNDPARFLDTGVIQIYRYLHFHLPYMHLRDGYDCYSHAAWNVTAWRVQLQPFHLSMLIRDVMRVDIRLFADLRSVMSSAAADTLVDQQFEGIDKLLDLPVNYDIIGGDFNRFKSCLMNFGYTVTVVFHLAPDVARALLQLIGAAVDHAASYQFGPTDAHSPTMYFYIANRCQYAIAHTFRRVLIGAITGRGDLVNQLKQPFPNLSPSSQFAADIMLIRGAGGTPECLPPTPGKKKAIGVGAPSPHPTTGGAAAPSPARPPAPAPAPAPSPKPSAQPASSPKAGKRLCTWYNTREGCLKTASECRGDHRDASTAAEKKMMKQFLKNHPDRNPK